MGQVAFDTQEFVETLESAGLPKDQAKAISIAVRKSHEMVDVATKGDIADVKRDLEDVRKELSADIAGVRKDMDARFEKHEAQMQARFEKTDAQIADVRKDMAARFEKSDAQIADVRKDMAVRFEQIDKHLDFSEKRFDRLEIKFDRLQWFLLAGILSLLFKDVIPKLWSG